MSSSISARLAARHHQRDYTPLSWSEYFDEVHDITSKDAIQSIDSSWHEPVPLDEGDSFRVYLRNFREPFAPKRKFGQKITDANQLGDISNANLNKYSQIPTLVLLHGGGYSGLTWASFTRHIEQIYQCRILAIDLRAHGDTKTTDEERMDIDTLVKDTIAVTQIVHQICGFPQLPKLVLVGHSMGGTIAVKSAVKCNQYLPSLAGFVVIDVVEGTAKDALPLMMSVLKTRPSKFTSLNNAIEWAVRSGMTKNPDSARVSMPGNLINVETGQLAIHDVPVQEYKIDNYSFIQRHKFHISLENLISTTSVSSRIVPPAGLPLPPRVNALRQDLNRPVLMEEPDTAGKNQTDSSLEERGESGDRQCPDTDQSSTDVSPQISIDDDGYKRPPDVKDSTGYCWRANLSKTQPFWNGWFDGLSADLLEAPVQGKFLLLAGIDRLDKTLTIGQMQGKFMMKVLPKCGHAVHEDVPGQVASVIGQFLIRNKFTNAVNTDE